MTTTYNLQEYRLYRDAGVGETPFWIMWKEEIFEGRHRVVCEKKIEADQVVWC